MTAAQAQTLEKMEAMLRRCRRRIVRARLWGALRDGLQSWLTALFIVTAVFLLLRVLVRFIGTPSIGLQLVSTAAAVLALVVFGRVLWRFLRGGKVRAAHAAERLDLSQANHNRIATAIALLRAGDDSRFARAAIDEGFACLERMQAAKPHLDPSTTSWRRKGGLLATTLALLLAGLWIQPAVRAPGDQAPIATTSPSTQSDPRPGVAPAAPIDPPAPAARHEAERLGVPPGREQNPAVAERGERPEPGKGSRSEGSLGRHATGGSRSSRSASDSRSAASGAGAKSDPSEAEPGKPRPPREAKEQTASQPKVEQENQKGGSINARGASGTASMRTTQNDWSSKVAAKSDDSDDSDQSEEPDEEMDPDKQRLGVQPALKNRTSSVSRELSLAMGSGVNKDTMKGRGGPNTEKKNRGTASMILGIPVPGFVKGRLLPGPTKSTQEEVEPSPREGEYATASGLAPARPEETPQERFRAPAELSASARDYLTKHHAKHNQPPTDDPPAE